MGMFAWFIWAIALSYHNMYWLIISIIILFIHIVINGNVFPYKNGS